MQIKPNLRLCNNDEKLCKTAKQKYLGQKIEFHDQKNGKRKTRRELLYRSKNQGFMYTLLNDTYETMRFNNPKANSREHLIPWLGLGLWLELGFGFGFGPSQNFQGKRFPWKISSTT